MDSVVVDAKKRTGSGRILRFGRSESFRLWLLAMPFILFVFVFSYIPLWGWIISFQRYTLGVPIFKNKWVGLYHFSRLLSGATGMGRIIGNTLMFSFLNMLASAAPVIVAILLNEIRSTSFRRLFQTLTSLPHFVSYVIVFSVVFSFLSLDDGLLNVLLMRLGLISAPLNILGDKRFTWYFITLVGMWKGVGWGAIVYLAAIAGIDPELYDAAHVDGAGRFRQTIHITVPGVLPTFAVLFLLNVASFLGGASFDLVFMFYNPMVQEKIMTIDYFVYQQAFQTYDYSFGTAIGILRTIVSLSSLVVVNEVARRILGRRII